MFSVPICKASFFRSCSAVGKFLVGGEAVENLKKVEFIAMQIIAVAAENGLTIAELELAADMAKEISKKDCS